jgi:hydroxymethylbilane synthase
VCGAANSPGELSRAFGAVEDVIVGARGSRLAQVMVRELITHLGACPVVRFRARSVMTAGDRDRKAPVRNLGSEGGAFTTQLEEELLAGRVDIVVHSLKDLPTAQPDGLVLAATPPRADPLDALCGATLEGLRPRARVGTGSARRAAQLKALRPDIEVVPIRGNVPPRLGRLKSGLDAVILAACGLRRLGLDDAITELLDPAQFPPSPGQGALAVQVRAEDRELLQMLNTFGDPDADAAVRAERALLGELHGGCSVPVGALATRRDGIVSLSAQVTSLDGRERVTGEITGTDPETAGIELASALRERGANAILDRIPGPAKFGMTQSLLSGEAG